MYIECQWKLCPKKSEISRRHHETGICLASYLYVCEQSLTSPATRCTCP